MVKRARYNSNAVRRNVDFSVLFNVLYLVVSGKSVIYNRRNFTLLYSRICTRKH